MGHYETDGNWNNAMNQETRNANMYVGELMECNKNSLSNLKKIKLNPIFNLVTLPVIRMMDKYILNLLEIKKEAA